MKIYKETSLQDFEFWSGAKDTAEVLTDEQLDHVESCLEETAPEDGYSEVDINDIFWFERDRIAEMLGFDSWEAPEESNSENE
jgi:hypothetical protein